MILTAIYNHDSSLRVVASSRPEKRQVVEVEVTYLDEMSLPINLWRLSLLKKSVIYPAVDTAVVDSSGPMTEDRFLSLTRETLAEISREGFDGLAAEMFLSETLTESKPFGNGEFVALLKRSPQCLSLQVLRGDKIVASLELNFDEFTVSMPRAEMTDRWVVNIDVATE